MKDLHLKNFAENVAKLLIDVEYVENISISIDGLEETHDRFRGVPGSYNTIINNIKKLKEKVILEQIILKKFGITNIKTRQVVKNVRNVKTGTIV